MPVFPQSCPFKTNFTHTKDGWTGLCLKLCLVLGTKLIVTGQLFHQVVDPLDYFMSRCSPRVLGKNTMEPNNSIQKADAQTRGVGW